MAAPRKRPPALKHGLFSHLARQEWRPEVRELADTLSGPFRDEPGVHGAALEASEAITWHRYIQKRRLETFERAALLRANTTPQERESALKLSARVKAAAAGDCEPLIEEVRRSHDTVWLFSFETGSDYFLQEEIEGHAAELRRLADYERRAISRKRKAIRRLDYERIEAERRAVHARPTGVP